MPLQTSGPISLNEIHIEAGGTSGTTASLNDADIRGLISKASGVTMSFSEWYGASAITSLVEGIGTTGVATRATYNPGYWGYSNGYLGTFSVTSGSLTDAFGATATSISLFANFQLGAITGDDTIYFRMAVNGVNNPTTWSSLSATVNGTTATFTRASATLISTSPNTIYQWPTSGEPFSTESSGTAFTWSVS